MRLIGKHVLTSLMNGDESTATWLSCWMAEVRDAHWKQPSDIKNQFPRAKWFGGNKFAFNVGESRYAFDVLVAFPQGSVAVTKLQYGEDSHEH